MTYTFAGLEALHKPLDVVQVEVQSAGDEASDRAVVEQRISSSMKDSLGTLRVVSDRGLAVGDVAVLDYEARIADNRELISGSKKEGLRFDTEDPERLAVPRMRSPEGTA